MLHRIAKKLERWVERYKPKSKLEISLLEEMVSYKGNADNCYPADCRVEERSIIEVAGRYSMTSIDRMLGLLRSIDYISQNKIAGDFIECGVWRGGSMMAAAMKLLQLKDHTRRLFLFDTFEGMTTPGEKDKQFDGMHANAFLATSDTGEKKGAYWCIADLNDVMATMAKSGYPQKRIIYVKGRVEETIPHPDIDKIALLRLDTDWYQSTMHELQYLYDKVVPGGIIIIDDYGHWDGARTAVDEFFSNAAYKPYLHRLDYTGRLLVKPMK